MAAKIERYLEPNVVTASKEKSFESVIQGLDINIKKELESIHKSLEDVFVEAKVSVSVLRDALGSIEKDALSGNKQAEILLKTVKEFEDIQKIIDRFISRKPITTKEANKVLDYLEKYTAQVQNYNKEISIDISNAINSLIDILSNQDISESVRKETLQTTKVIIDKLKTEQLNFVENLSTTNLEENAKFIQELVKSNERAKILYEQVLKSQGKEKEELLNQLKEILKVNIENNEALNSILSLDEKSLTLDEAQTNQIVKNLKRVADSSYGFRINDNLKNLDRSMDKIVLQTGELKSALEKQTAFGSSIEEFFKKNPKLASLGESAKEEALSYLGPIGDILQLTGLDEKVFSFFGKKATSILSKLPFAKKIFSGGEKLVSKVGVEAGGSILSRLGSKVIDKEGGSVLTKAASKEGGSILSRLGGKFFAKEGGGLLSKFGGKFLAKTGGKSLLKKIPLVGALAGGAFGLQRMMKGDFLGGLGEITSGLVSDIPVIGTAASLAIDTALAARDIKQETEAPKVPNLTTKDMVRSEINKERLTSESVKSTTEKIVREVKTEKENVVVQQSPITQGQAVQEGVDDSDLLVVRSLLFGF